jgi:hypothetical protein
MAKDPAMLWYWADWNSGTTTLSRFFKGCYMDLLHAQFNSGHLSLEEIKTVLGSDFGQAWPALQKKFAVDQAGKYFNERLEVEKNKRANYTASRKKNLTSSHMDTHKASHMDLHMDNVNIDVSILKEVCKIFGKEYQPPKDRMPSEANWFRDIENQAKILEASYPPGDAVKQVKGYLKYCRQKDRKLIGTAHKAAETILSSNWLALLGEVEVKIDKYKDAEWDKGNLTLAAWEAQYAYKLKHDKDFRKHFGYAEFSISEPMGK